MPVSRRGGRVKSSRKTPRFDARLTLIIAAALIGAFLRFTETRSRIAEPLVHTDDIEYYALGRSVRERGFLTDPHRSWRPTAMRGMLYPSFIAAASGLSHNRRGAVRWAQAVLGVAAIIAVGALGWAVYSPMCGVLAAFLLAFDPRHIASGAELFIEHFYGFALIWVALMLVAFARDKRPGWAAAAAWAIGVTLTCRSTLFALPLVAAAWGLRERKRGQAPWLLLAAFLFLVPWTLRNAYLFQSFIPFEQGTSTAALVGASKGMTVGPLWRELNEEADNRHRREAYVRIVTRPHVYLWGVVKRVPRLLLWIGAELGWVGLPLAAWGMWAARGVPGMAGLNMLILYFVGVHLLIAPQQRYLYPLIPLLLVMVSAGLLALGEKWKWVLKSKPEVLPPVLGRVIVAGGALLTALVAIGVMTGVREVRAFSFGQGLLSVSAYQAGLADVQQRLARHPEDLELLAERAALRGELSDWAGSGADWEVVVRHAPGNITARLALARALRKTRRIDEALTVLDDAEVWRGSGKTNANEFVWADVRAEREEIVRIRAERYEEERHP
jgi:hypothetical protein